MTIEEIEARNEERRRVADLTQTELHHEELTAQTVDDIDILLAEIERLRGIIDTTGANVPRLGGDGSKPLRVGSIPTAPANSLQDAPGSTKAKYV